MKRMPSAERRRQLIEGAIRAMMRDGAARTTTRSIAAEAGVSLSVVHYCFDSKQALLEAVMETITEHSATEVRAAVEPKSTLRETVRGALATYWDHLVSNPAEHMLTYELSQYALRQPGFEHLARRQYENYTTACGTIIQQVIAAHGHESTVPLPVLARYLATMVDGLTLNFLVLGEKETAEAVLDTVADHVASLTRPAAETA